MHKTMKHGKTSRITFIRKTGIVDAKIIDALYDVLALVIDGWTDGDTHHVAILSAYPSQDFKWGCQNVLFGFASVKDEDFVNAQAHFEHIQFVLRILPRSLKNVSALIVV